MRTSIYTFLLCTLITNSAAFVLWTHPNTICQNGKSQSPIMINISQTDYVPYLSFTFSAAYLQSTVFQLVNKNGEMIVIDPFNTTSQRLYVSGGCLSGVFTFQSVHLHWPQSEHRFTKKNYVAEAHFVHKNLDTHETAVFAYFLTQADFQSNEQNDSISDWDSILQRIVNGTRITRKNGLSSLMQGKVDQFIHYHGSLTTAPCTEGVLWVLVASAIPLQQSTLDRLRTNIIQANYREIQPINSRVIQRSFSTTNWDT